MKKTISLLIVLVMALSLFSVNVIAEDAHEHDGVVFTAWSGTTSLPDTAGNYYLAVDVELEESWTAPDGEVNLCLNGHTIIHNNNNVNNSGAVSWGSALVYVNSGNSLDLYDCSDDESGTIELVGEYRDGGIKNRGTLTVNGGTISGLIGIYNSGGTLTVNGGTISGDRVGIENGESSTLNVNGGTIIGGTNGIYALYKLYLSGDAEISGASADIELAPGQYIGTYITIAGKLENTKPYTVAKLNFDYNYTGGVFTNTDPENLEFNDPSKFASVEDGYIVIKNDDGQLELVIDDGTYGDDEADDESANSGNLCEVFDEPVGNFLRYDGFMNFNAGIDTPSWIIFYTILSPNVAKDYPWVNEEEVSEDGYTYEWTVRRVPQDVLESWAKIYFADVDVEAMRQPKESVYHVVSYDSETQTYKYVVPERGGEHEDHTIAGYIDKGDGRYDVYFYHMAAGWYYSEEDAYKYEDSEIKEFRTKISGDETYYWPVLGYDMVTINYDGEYCQYVSHEKDLESFPEGLITPDTVVSDDPSPEPEPDDGEDTNAPHAYDEDGNEIDIIVEDIDSGDEFDALEELEDVEAVAVFKITIPEGITGLLTFDIYAPGATEKSIVMIYDEWEEVENANLVVDGDRVKFTIDAELLAKYPYVAIVNAVEGEDDNPSMGIVLAALPMLAAAAAVVISKKR